jgi:hypothetical protein
MTSLLILTVGTGTAGRHSDVAQGLTNTIDRLRPRRFWLVPSTDPKSVPVADNLLRSHFEAADACWNSTLRPGSLV